MVKAWKAVIPIFVILVLVIPLLAKNNSFAGIIKNTNEQKVLAAKSVKAVLVSPTVTPSPIPTSTPTPIPTFIPTPTSTPIPIPTSTPIPVQISNNLLDVINSYRQAKGLGSLSGNSTLCDIAQNRVNELLVLGHLDNHDGWSKYFSGQHNFSFMGEIIAYASYDAGSSYVVNSIWGQSTEHMENMSDPKWTNGCGGSSNGSAGYFYTFEFGRN